MRCSCSINILMEGYHTPFRIRVLGNGLTNYIIMGCTVIVIGVNNNKQYITIGIVIICTGVCFTCCISCQFTFLIVWIIKVISILCRTRIVISNRRCHRQRPKSICAQITGILFFISCLIYLVTGRYHKAHIMVSCCLIQYVFPASRIIFISNIL